ncbi:hypothetical protein BDN72DRAFT_830599 [Pluteus cervinus]|uniref:Uncharacterized protein n=1 Tax=Pluteus cervinus TaxID=181527 RepID=A0ACD3BI82_9AGAR|nr:hypothetical protein BDN72DRAFT_830599 [Pluteus cervinus]
MSARREPLWFCHECHSEMRPLMVPDPVCASCRSSFVEKMENAEDNPRDFAHDADPDFSPGGAPSFDHILYALLNARRSPNARPSPPGTRSHLPFPPVPTLSPLGRPASPPDADPVLNFSEFLRRGPEPPDGIAGPLMMQYLLSLLGPRHEPLGRMGPANMGDYVFNQEALDRIITQLMENSSGNRPVPATDEIVAKLPREVLEDESPLLQKDCAVCKEQFKVETEDADELVVITLPCHHPFHEPCILPWLKSSGTCPVCRHALVPQPSHHPPGQPDHESGESSNPHPNRASPSRPSALRSLFGGSHASGSSEGRPSRSNSDPASRSNPHRRNSRQNFPGGWGDEED